MHRRLTMPHDHCTRPQSRVREAFAQGSDFRLTVRNGRVEGYVGDSWVSFRAPKAKPVTVAQR